MTTPLSRATLERLDRLLAGREAELDAMLQAGAAARPEAGPTQVDDFKQMAADEAQHLVDDAAAARAAAELDEVLAARHRIAHGGYGTCLECGEPIDERRLLAQPAAPLCAGCQAQLERAAALRPFPACRS
jgi:DnaK suppressor protein